MAVYKVPQDVEAEDKLLGPLTFKQFIFMLIAAGSTMLGWLLFGIHPALSLLAVPFVVIFGGLAVFRREDQPVERYLLSFFNFTLRPRTRVWSTEGYYEHLIITAPKRKAAPQLKQDIGQVHGQLEKLAQTVDTRGWASKRPGLHLPGRAAAVANDDRLFMPDAPAADDGVDDDVMNNANPEAVKLDKLIDEQAKQHKDRLIKQMDEQTRKPASNVSGSDNSTDDDHADDDGQDDEKDASIHMAGTDSQPQPANPDILKLSDELKVSQMAAAVNRQPDDQQLEQGEEIRLR